MGIQRAQIKKKAREKQAVILRRNLGRILHRRENSEADCAEATEHELPFSGHNRNAAVDRKQSSILKAGSKFGALARIKVLSRAPIFPCPKHPHTVPHHHDGSLRPLPELTISTRRKHHYVRIRWRGLRNIQEREKAVSQNTEYRT
jgi:hypothetical protein